MSLAAVRNGFPRSRLGAVIAARTGFAWTLRERADGTDDGITRANRRAIPGFRRYSI